MKTLCVGLVLVLVMTFAAPLLSFRGQPVKPLDDYEQRPFRAG